MALSENLDQFHGLPVFDLVPALDEGAELPDAAAVAWKIGLDYDSEETFEQRWEQFLAAVDTERVTAVVIGAWWQDEQEPAAETVRLVAGSAGRLPALRALFFGEVTYEQCEISWIQQSDVTPFLTAFPRLAELVVRGASGGWDGEPGLVLQPVRHEALRTLRFESGGLPGEVVRAVGACDFPALESLELWLGVDQYGGDATMADLEPILGGLRLPALRRLGLLDSLAQDEIAAAVAHAPVVARLDHLGLAMGVLTDEGAGALLEGQPLTHLTSLDLHHHFLTKPMQQRLTEALPGVEVDLSEAGAPDERWRYVAVAE
ncbi:STM4015 family protein [Kitasatospora sp. MBT63]|uniref:STM4015 family protein n=1 Tax=Kitasatospora sp. MBT63 TaxID=1444768 RepID=UPI00053A3FBD|nr:STM4015 family protein [Kitasatospora sp. MBT63]